MEHDLEKAKKLISEGVTLIRVKETQESTSIVKENGQFSIEFSVMNGKCKFRPNGALILK